MSLILAYVANTQQIETAVYQVPSGGDPKKGTWTFSQTDIAPAGDSPAIVNTGYGLFVMAWKGAGEDVAIYSTISTDGIIWQLPAKSIPGVVSNYSPVLTTYKGNVYMAWRGLNEDNDVYTAQSQDGIGWTMPTAVGYIATSSRPGYVIDSTGTNQFVWKGDESDVNLYGSMTIPHQITGSITDHSPALVHWNNGGGSQYLMAYKGAEGDQRISWSFCPDGGNWAGSIATSVTTSHGPALGVDLTEKVGVMMVWKNATDNGMSWAVQPQGGDWTSPSSIQSLYTVFGPALCSN